MSFLSSRNTLIGLTAITGLIHLGLGIATSDNLFILNGVGYLVLLYLTFWTPAALKGQSGLIRWALIGYTAVTIIGYFASWGLDGFTQVVGMITKVVEVLLLVGLWQSRS